MSFEDAVEDVENFEARGVDDMYGMCMNSSSGKVRGWK